MIVKNAENNPAVPVSPSTTNALYPECEETFNLMWDVFHGFMERLPEEYKPKIVNVSMGSAYRFTQKDPRQAIILKLARVQSALRAAMVLVESRFAQEFYILLRAIDETNEDILFLSCGIPESRATLHEKFLNAFWEEEIKNPRKPHEYKKIHPPVPRKSIRKFLVDVNDSEVNKNEMSNHLQFLYKLYSGFVHGGAPQIMEMYVGNPPNFCINGMPNTQPAEDAKDAFIRCVHRTLMTHIIAAKVFGVKEFVDILMKHKEEFEQASGIGRDNKKIEMELKSKK